MAAAPRVPKILLLLDIMFVCNVLTAPLMLPPSASCTAVAAPVELSKLIAAPPSMADIVNVRFGLLLRAFALLTKVT